MGSGVLKTLSSYKIPHDQFLYVFSCSCHSLKPRVCLLLWSLSGGLCDEGFFVTDTSVINYHIASLAWTQCPVSLIIGLVPGVLRVVVAQMSLFMTCVALNFA